MNTFNGWTNHETWAANLWLTNDEYTYFTIAKMGARQIKAFVEELKEEDDFDSMFEEIGEIDNVNWEEIAEGLRE